MRKTLSLVISVIMVVSLLSVGVFAAEGTAINNADDFKNMAADGVYYLAADITVDTTYETDFVGTLDGNGKTVTVSVPMFKQMNGTVKNLTVVGSVTVSEGNVGAVANQAANATFENIVNKANVTNTMTAGDACVGGICGKNNNKGPNKFISCINEGAITGPEATGGICGEAQNLDATFENCYNKGNITSVDTGSGVAAAGIIGYNGTNAIIIKNCTNDGDITSAFRAGGISGDARKCATVENCVNNGAVKGGDVAGGIVAYAGDKNLESGLTVTNCINNGDVTGTNKVGGIVGYAYGTNGNAAKSATVSGCINNGTITIDAYMNKGALADSFASEFIAYTNSTCTIIKNCIGTGAINTTGDASMTHIVIVGLSNADVTQYTAENLYIADNGAVTHFSWTATADNAASIVEFSAVDGKDLEGSATVKAVTRGTLGADLIAKANTAIGAGTYEIKDGKAVFASLKVGSSLVETPDPVTPGTDPVVPGTDPVTPPTTEPDSPVTGDNAYIVVVALAVVAVVGSACFFTGKKVTE